jgi:hypothetical protein
VETSSFYQVAFDQIADLPACQHPVQSDLSAGQLAHKLVVVFAVAVVVA